MEWQFVTIMYTYCIPSNSLNPPSPSQAEQNHAQSWNKCGYVMANVVIIWPSLYPDKYCCHHRLLLVWFMIIVEASHHLWFMAPATAAGVMSPGQDIGVGAAKFNFRKYPVLFPTFISSLRLKFTTRLPYSLRTQNPHRTLFRKVAFYGKINYAVSCFY